MVSTVDRLIFAETMKSALWQNYVCGQILKFTGVQYRSVKFT